MCFKFLISMLFCLSIVACTTSQPKDANKDTNKVSTSSTTAASRSVATVDPQQFLYSFDIDRAAGERFIPEDNLASEQQEYQKLIVLFSDHFKNKYGDASLR